MKRQLTKALTELQEMLLANVNTDWSANDPIDEFQALADIVKSKIPTERDFRVDELGQLISDDDVSEALTKLEAQAEIDGSVDAWNIVSIWQPFENDGWTVDDLLDKL